VASDDRYSSSGHGRRSIEGGERGVLPVLDPICRERSGTMFKMKRLPHAWHWASHSDGDLPDDLPAVLCLGVHVSMTEIGDRVRNVVARVLEISPDQVTREMTLKDLGADSFDLIEIIVELEKESNAPIPCDVANHIRTVQNAIDLIESPRLLS
jgi:acyl carrier protein